MHRRRVYPPADIPELTEHHIHFTSMQDDDVRAHATAVYEAHGELRLAPHPLLREHKMRLCITDRWHQLVGKLTHKRATCQQHLAAVCRSLTHDRSNMMESLNARQRHYYKTICTANPVHAIPLYHRLVYWENRKVLEQQEVEVQRANAAAATGAQDS